MYKFLIDTCVWLDVAKDSSMHPILSVIEELIKLKKMSLIVPRCVLDEFERNRERVAQESNQSLKSVMGRVRDTIDKFGDEATKQIAIDHINNVNFKLPFLGEKSTEILPRIEAILKAAEIIESSESIRLRAIQRAIDKKAPFHRNKNSINDAIIFESYVECMKDVNGAKTKFAFVTRNKLDFSQPAGNENSPHPDLADAFTKGKSTYSINLPQALYKIGPRLIEELMVEFEDWALFF